MESRPTLLLAGAALAVAVVLGIIGYSLGVSLALWKGSLIGLEQVVLETPNDARGVERATALLFAWPAIVAGIVSAVHVHRFGMPPPRQIALYLAIPLLALAGATVLQVLSIKSELASAVQPIITLKTLGPGGAEVKVGAFVAAVMCLYVVVKRPV